LFLPPCILASKILLNFLEHNIYPTFEMQKSGSICVDCNHVKKSAKRKDLDLILEKVVEKARREQRVVEC
jgi:hypothetical protein